MEDAATEDSRKGPLRKDSPKVVRVKKKQNSQVLLSGRSESTPTIIAFPTKLPSQCDLPRDAGHRYVLAECDLNCPQSQLYLAHPELWYGDSGVVRPVTSDMYRSFVPTRMQLSVQEKAPQLLLSPDSLTVTGDKGYSMVRGSHAVTHGRYYFEFKVLAMPEGSAVRAGWSTHNGLVQAPLGYDQFGYSWRSKKGTIFHSSRGMHYSEGYGEGDVIGCFIHLPVTTVKDLLPESCKHEAIVKYKSHVYFEVKDDTLRAAKRLKPVKGSKIIFYKNGTSQGVAFSDIYAGHYFPSISLYRNAEVRVNFGPVFDFPPQDITYLPMNERVIGCSVEQTISDIIFTICASGPGKT